MTESLGVQYDAEDLVECIRRRSEQALQEKQITLQESQRLLQPTSRVSVVTLICLLNRCQVSGWVSVLYPLTD